MIYRTFQIIFWPLFFIIAKSFFGFQAVNKGNIDLKNIKGPIIIVSNHIGRLDALLIGLVFPLFNKIYPIRFMVADGFFRIPVVAQFIKLMGGFPTLRKNGLENSLKLPW